MAKPGNSAKPGPLVKHTFESESNANRQRPPALLIPHPPSVGSRFAASGSTPSKSLPLNPRRRLTTSPPTRRSEGNLFRPEGRSPVSSGGLRKPGAGRGSPGKACHRDEGSRFCRSPPLPRAPEKSRPKRIFYLLALHFFPTQRYVRHGLVRGHPFRTPL
jgi:hypothetical protein